MFAHILKLLIQNRFQFALTITSAFEIHWMMFFMLRCLLLPSPSSLLALNFKSAFSLQGFLGVKSSPARIYSRRSCVCCSVPFAWEIAWDSPIVNIVSQTMNKQVRYNQLQKYLRHCTVFWHKWPIHDLVLLIPPPPGPLSMLLAIQDHTQNLEQQLWMGGRREVSVISQRPVTRSDLKQERSFFLWSVSTFLQLVVALHEYFGHWWEIAFSSRMLPRNETCAVTSNYCKTSWRTPSDIYMQRWALRVCSSPGSACGLRTTRALRVSGDYYLTLLGASQEIIVLLRTPTKYRSILL